MQAKRRFRLATGLMGIVFWMSATPALAAVMDVTGALPRNFSEAQFDLNIKVTQVTQTEYEAGLQDENAAERLAIIIGSNNNPIKFEGEEGYDAEGQRYYLTVKEVVPAEPDATLANHWQYEYTITVNDRSGGANLEDDTGDDNVLGVIVEFFLGGRDTTPVFTNENNPAEIRREIYVVTEAPRFEAIGLRGVYESLIVDYVPTTSVTTSDGTNRAPSLVKAVAIDTAVITGDRTFPAKQFTDAEGEQDSDTTCTYTAANIDGGACITCDDNVYLNMTQMGQINGVRIANGVPADGSTTISRLENRAEGEPVYAVFMQYEPSGIDQSNCLIGRPTKDITMTEQNKAGEAEILDIRCLIASAAYGSALHRDVNLFRAFRDRVLLKFSLGEWFVHRYYEYSPPLAAAIESNPIAKATTRWLLGIPAAVLDLFYDDDERP